MPAPPPAIHRMSVKVHSMSIHSVESIISIPIKFVAAEAGFLPLGPCVDFADIVRESRRCTKGGKKG